MGLDITAYSNLELLPPHTLDEAHWEDHIFAFAYKGFERSMRGLADADKPFDKPFAGIGGRCYVATDETQTFAFRAGSYGGYGMFRDQLAMTGMGVSDAREVWVNTAAYVDKPFFEIVNFADNEGAIGPEAAADLLDDFRTNREEFELFTADEYDLARYDDWTRACELAAENGLISFH